MAPSRSIVAILAGACFLSVLMWCIGIHRLDVSDERWVAAVLQCQLGNQLWIMASSYGIAMARKARWCVVDGEFYSYLRGLEWIVKPPESCPGLILGIPKVFSWNLYSFVRVDGGGYATYSDEFVNALQPRIDARNFLQSFKYFDKMTPIPFRLKSTPHALAWVRMRHITTAIHVRRGDKMTDIGNVVPSLSYFHKALRMLYFLFPGQHAFVVVTDDPAWVKAQVLFEGMHLLHSDDPLFDMAVISQCRHKIISIGTFGWWGAFLTDSGSNSSNAVIYPVPQMEGRYSSGMTYGDYFPQHWTAIDYMKGDDFFFV